MDWSELPELFPGFDSPGRWLPLLQRHQELLGAAEGHTRVTAVAPEDAVQRHFAESLETWRIALESTGGGVALVADVGSGGGFPGLVMACVAPAVRFELIEPLRKRARLLEGIAEELGLANVDIHACRAEEAGRGSLRDCADLVTARAVAELRELLEYTVPLCATGRHIVLPKGSALGNELADAENAMYELGVSWQATASMRGEISGTVRLAVFSKDASTADRYPRRPGVPGRRPL